MSYPPTVLNRVAAGAMVAVTGLVIAGGASMLSSRHGAVLSALLLAYAVALGFGVWRVRPRRRGSRAFTVLFVPVLLQVSTYLVFWAVMLQGMEGLVEGAARSSTLLVAFFALLAGPLLVAPLVAVSDRFGLLLAAEILGPVAIGAWLS